MKLLRVLFTPYIPMRQGCVYLVLIIDWTSCRVLTCWLSNRLTADFRIDVVEEVVTRYGKSETFNTDQGSQFISSEFTGVLKENCIRIGMDSKGYLRGNVFVERFWRAIVRLRRSHL